MQELEQVKEDQLTTELIAEVKSRQHMELEEEDGETDRRLNEIQKLKAYLKQKT